MNKTTVAGFVALALVSAGLITPRALRPDALVIPRAMLASTVSEIFVHPDSVVVELEIGAADVQAFRDLLPDELYERLGYEPEPWIDRLRRFTAEGFTIAADDRPADGRLTDLEVRKRTRRDQVTGEPLPVQPEDAETVVFARLLYKFSGRPETLTVGPPGSRPGDPIASIGFVAYHGGLHVNDFRYLGQPEKLVLDWDDPWFSEFENRNLWRQYRSPISAFLYIEPYEVRKEVVIRPLDVQQWVDLGLDGKSVITVEEQPEIKRRVAEFLAERGAVTIDGQPGEGFVDRVDFIYRTLRTSGVVQPDRDLMTSSATLGVIFVYPTDGLPDEVSLEWDLFSDRYTRIPAAMTDEAGGLPYVLTEDDPVLVWRNFLTNPTVPGLVEVADPPGPWRRWIALGGWVAIAAILLIAIRFGRAALRGDRQAIRAVVTAAGVGLLLAVVHGVVFSDDQSEEQTEVVLAALLLNIYKAFDYRDEDVIYDALENSASGDLLTDIYLETRRSLELANQGGARAKVKHVEVLSTETTPIEGGDGFAARAVWNVAGSVGHWGHVHQRVNQYEADLTVRVVDDAWKITGLEVLQEQRLPAPGQAPLPGDTDSGAGGG